MAKLFIVTYNAPNELNQNLESLAKSDFVGEIFIINNYSKNFHINNYPLNIKILHNACRADFSTGHLARNWNQALIQGYQNLNNPQTDFVITVQDDVIFEKNWFRNLTELHKRYTFIQHGIGDMFCSYTAEGVKAIGLWDERFCNIGYQEADYFLRALIYNKNNSIIMDYRHKRVLNEIAGLKICNRIYDQDFFSECHKKSKTYHHLSLNMFEHKWGIKPEEWDDRLFQFSKYLKPLSVQYMLYPYFEKDIDHLVDKGYLI